MSPPCQMLAGLALLATAAGGLTWWGQQASVPVAWNIAACAVLVLILRAVMQRWFIAPIDALIRCANRITACDLTQVVTRDRNDRYGELPAALGQMSVNLQSIVPDARDQNMRMLTSAQGMSNDTVELAQRTEGQATSLQQAVTALEQVTAAARATAESARDVAAASTQAMAVTEHSAASVDELGQTMESIRDASVRIHDIIKVIDSVALQTNILALNAAVEAARAETTRELEQLAEATTETVRVFRIDSGPQEMRDAVALRREVKQRENPLGLTHA